MYFRLYPSKNNTLISSANDSDLDLAKLVNTGSNTIMELQEGKNKSVLLFKFDYPEWLSQNISKYNTRCNLKLWDAGVIYEPLLPMKEVVLTPFFDDFTEGNGWSFLKNKAISGISNWKYRLNNMPWSTSDINNIEGINYHLNKDNEDLIFDVSNFIDPTKSNINFKLEVNKNNLFPTQIQPIGFPYNLPITLDTQPTIDVIDTSSVYAKFIYSRHTRTVFKPYLEFFIEDEIDDKSENIIAGRLNKIYFINQNNEDFSGILTADVIMDNNITSITAINDENGIYYIELTPNDFDLTEENYASITWKIEANSVYKQMVKINSINKLDNGHDLKKLNFYVVSNNKVIRQGDNVMFEIMSFINGVGNITMDSYEYMIISNNGFEMTPWTKTSVYRDNIYFFVNTSFFYPNTDYEVVIRINSKRLMTSNNTYKFRVIENAQSHLRDLSASPYYSREWFFSK